MSNKPITTNSLRREVSLERWDKRGIPVRVELPDGTRLNITGVHNDRDALVLSAEAEEAKVDK